MLTEIDKSVRMARNGMKTEAAKESWNEWKVKNTIKTAKMNVDVAKQNAKHFTNSAELIKKAETIHSEVQKFFDGSLPKEKLSKETNEFLFFKMPNWGTYGT